MPRKGGKNTPTIVGNGFIGAVYQDGQPTGVSVGSIEFDQWLRDTSTFYFTHKVGSFTARCEQKYNGCFWYAFKKIDGKTHRLYIGKQQAISMARLIEIAMKFSDMAEGGDASQN